MKNTSCRGQHGVSSNSYKAHIESKLSCELLVKCKYAMKLFFKRRKQNGKYKNQDNAPIGERLNLERSYDFRV